MRKTSKRKSRCPTRNYILIAFAVVAITTIIYEAALFITLDYRISNIPYINSVILRRAADDSNISASGGVTSLRRIHADAVLQEFSGFSDNSIDDIKDEQVINSVHYVWCGNKTFTFTNYLSILSVWKILRPDVIEFHQAIPPKSDKYDNWFIELKNTIPNLAIRQMPPNWDGDDKGCGFWFGLAVIDDRGGIYINEHVILTEKILDYRKKTLSVIFSKTPHTPYTNVVVAMGNDHEDSFRAFRRNFGNSREVPENSDFCEILQQNFEETGTAPCYTAYGILHPYHIFELETNFGALARRLMYGSDLVKQASPILPGTIPKIVHYVWFGIKEMDFMMYLSMLSALYIVNAERVLVHTDGGLTGKYWTKLLKDKRIIIVKREKPFDIYGHQILYAQHRSDIVRAECLLKYGGIYMDWDALWLRNPDELLNSGYDALANFDHMQQGKYPETINLGVLMAKQKSTFIKRWQDALKNYRSDDFLYNAVLLPYKVYEKYPEYLKIERSLQVMCFRLKCHPTFQPDFKNFMEDQPFDWRKDVYSIHFTYPDPHELVNEDACRNGNGRFAEMGRHILTYEHHLPD